MPTYTYVCTKCGNEIEVVQSMSDPPLKRCRKCKGALRRTFHPVGIVLKGSGFHRNDYRSTSKPSSEKKETKPSESTSSEKSSDNKKTESKKPAASSGD